MLSALAPVARASVHAPWIASFALGFVGLDYAQYWAHRLLHRPALFRLHLCHHSLPSMRALGAFRHSLGEYVVNPVSWLVGIATYLLADRAGLMTALVANLVLDAHRHSTLETVTSGPGRWLAALLMTPEDHAVHHESPPIEANYGGNLKLWDQLHGTYRAPSSGPTRYGVVNDDGALRLLLLGASLRGRSRGSIDVAFRRFTGVAILALAGLELALALGATLVALDASGRFAWTSRAVAHLAKNHTGFGAIVGVAVTCAAAQLAVPSLAASGPSKRSGLVASQLGALALLGVLAFALASSAPGSVLVVDLSAAGVVGLAIASAWLGLSLLPKEVAFASGRAALLGSASGVLGALVYGARPASLQRLTLVASDALIQRLFAHPDANLARDVVGTREFRVRITEDCSGVEGLSLGAIGVLAYLLLARRELRFPRALALLPFVALLLLGTNVLRIVAFIAVGQVASFEAREAFHSAIGWLVFVGVLGVAIPAGERLFRLRIDAVASFDAPPNDAAPYLVPLIASLGVAVVASLLALGDSPLALGRYVVAAAFAVFALRRLGSLRPRSVLVPIVAGLSVAGLYVATSPEGAPVSPLAHTTLNGSSLALAALHVLGFSLVTPLVEELAFRGFLARRLSSHAFLDVPYERVSVLALVLSSLAFGAMHGAFVQASIAGLAFALAARTAGLGGAVLAHAVANGTLVACALGTGQLAYVS